MYVFIHSKGMGESELEQFQNDVIKKISEGWVLQGIPWIHKQKVVQSMVRDGVLHLMDTATLPEINEALEAAKKLQINFPMSARVILESVPDSDSFPDYMHEDMVGISVSPKLYVSMIKLAEAIYPIHTGDEWDKRTRDIGGRIDFNNLDLLFYSLSKLEPEKLRRLISSIMSGEKGNNDAI